MEIPDYPEFSKRTEQNVSKMQVNSVSDEVISRLHPGNSGTKTNSEQQSSKSVKCNPNQAMETLSTQSPKFHFDPSRAPQKKAKQIRMERKQNKLLAQGKTQEEINAMFQKKKLQNTGKTLEDFFEEIGNCANKLEVLIFFFLTEFMCFGNQ